MNHYSWALTGSRSAQSSRRLHTISVDSSIQVSGRLRLPATTVLQLMQRTEPVCHPQLLSMGSDPGVGDETTQCAHSEVVCRSFDSSTPGSSVDRLHGVYRVYPLEPSHEIIRRTRDIDLGLASSRERAFRRRERAGVADGEFDCDFDECTLLVNRE